MSRKHNKKAWENIKANKNKCCANCSQLEKGNDGNYRCMFSTSYDQTSGACLLIQAPEIFHPGKICFDKYNGKNVKNGVRYYNKKPALLQNIVKRM